MLLPHFDVFCDLLLNRRTATWNLFLLYNNPSYSRILIGSRLWSIRGQTHDWGLLSKAKVLRSHYATDVGLLRGLFSWRKLKVKVKGPDLLSGAPATLRRREVGNGGITLKTHQMFSVHSTPEEFKNAKLMITGRSFWICVWGKLGRGNHMIIVLPSCFQIVFRPHENAFLLHFPSLKNFFEKFCFSLVWTVGLTEEINFSGAVWTLLTWLYYFFILNIMRRTDCLRSNEPQTECFIYNSVNLMANVLKLWNVQHAGPKYVTLY